MSHHPGREFGLFLEGELSVELDLEKYRLKPGDSIIFDSTTQLGANTFVTFPHEARPIHIAWIFSRALGEANALNAYENQNQSAREVMSMTMDDMAKAVADKTGMSVDQSKMAVQAVVDVIMSNLPPQMGEMVKNVMMGNMGDMSKMMGDMSNMMGDMDKKM